MHLRNDSLLKCVRRAPSLFVIVAGCTLVFGQTGKTLLNILNHLFQTFHLSKSRFTLYSLLFPPWTETHRQLLLRHIESCLVPLSPTFHLSLWWIGYIWHSPRVPWSLCFCANIFCCIRSIFHQCYIFLRKRREWFSFVKILWKYSCKYCYK